MSEVDLSIGIVAYNALEKLRACLASLVGQTGLSHEVTVVDNASAEPVAAMVEAEFPTVRLVVSPTNLGFAGGTNLALAEAPGRLVLLLNPDTVLPTTATLAALVARYDEALEPLGALGCRLELADGTTQPVSGRFPRALSELADLAHLRRPRPFVAPTGPLAAVEYVTGACLLTSAAIWREVGGLDEGYFMYLEDVDWCRRAAARGYRCAVAADLTVRHHEGASYGGRAFLRREHYWRSLVRYVRRHDGPLAAAALRAGLVLLTLPKLAAGGLDRSPDRAARRALLAAQLRLGLTGR